MNQQQFQQSTSSQHKQIKRAKRIFWVGILLIIIVGLAAAVYFMFMRPMG